MKFFLQMTSRLMLLLCTLWSANMHAQGSTTSTISGKITGTDNLALIGASVEALHTPSGTSYGTIANDNGFFTIPNVRVGGPYTITITYIGFQELKKENQFLSLGQTLRIDAVLSESVNTLSGVEIKADRNAMQNQTSGPETRIGKDELAILPTLNRDFTDFTRLTPQAIITPNGGISIAGMNNRYNSIFIDGAVNNDVYGISETGTNGGQTAVSPISMDAIEQIQVVVAPYDVRLGGFAGGGINAVTRSGTNQFEGSIYGLYRNQNLAGKTPLDYDPAFSDSQKDSVDDTRIKLRDFNSYILGFRIGGPIIKNKLFFFANAEIQRETTPLPGLDFANYLGASSAESIAALENKLINEYNYNPGTYLGSDRKTIGNKFLAKLDYNLNSKNRLSLRHSYSQSSNDIISLSSKSVINYSNGNYVFPNTTNSTAFEWNTIFNNQLSNNLILGFTNVRDDRDPIGGDFPRVIIKDGAGGTINLGSEEFSTANELNQNVFTITDNLTMYKGKHTLTLGTHNEFYKMYNLFIRQNYGTYTYDSLAGFMQNLRPSNYTRSYSLLENDITGDGSKAAAEFSAMQLGIYLQDEIAISDRFNLSVGIRVDVPLFLDDPKEDVYFNTIGVDSLSQYWDLKGARAGKMPKASLLFSPRIGFNYDIKGDRSLILRGGVGIFTSRLPFVWTGGAYTNNGVLVGGVTVAGNNIPADFTFNPDPFNQPTAADLGQTQKIPSGEMDIFAKDFKYPQVARGSLGLDVKLPAEFTLTLEGIYSKILNNINYTNVNYKPTPDSYTTGPDVRGYYKNRILPTVYSNNIYLADNTNEGYSYNLSALVQKQFSNGFYANIGYTFGRSKVLNEATSSQNASQWRFMESVNGMNDLELTTSDFDLGHRIMAAVSYQFKYLKNFGTTISVFYNGLSGTPFSYVIRGNQNGLDLSSSSTNALVFVPTADQLNQMLFKSDADKNNFDAFIEADDYLKNRRGQYAERNGARMPFSHVLDLKIIQDFYIPKKNGGRHNFQITFDVFNFTNLINKEWGRKYFVSNDLYSLLNLENASALASGAETQPKYSFVKPKATGINNIDDSGVVSSRWQGQIGVRYSF
ncbi:MAG: carboxypeptidase regulatory-like domain-containing protein [Saprospiraceae bacterium]